MFNQILIPVTWEVYVTQEKEKLIITEGYDDKTLISYVLYSFGDIDDVLVCGIDTEYLEYKKKMFIQERNLILIKKGVFKRESIY